MRSALSNVVLPLLFPQILFPVSVSKEKGISVRFNQPHHQFIYPVFFRVSIHPLQGNSIAIIIRNETILSVFLMAVEIAFPFLVFEVRSKSQVSVKVKARRNRFKPSLSPPPLTFVSFPPSSSLIAL